MVRILSNRVLLFLWLVTVFAILFFGLWPFGFPIPNRVTVLSDPPGIRFLGGKGLGRLNVGGIVYTPPLVIQQTKRFAPGSISLAFRVKADPEFTNGGGTIVALYDEGNRLKLLFGQWQFHLIIRTFYFATDKRGPYTEIGAREILSPGRSGWITVTSDTNGTSIYFEGQLIRSVANVRLLPAMADFSGYRIYLGNEPDVRAPWKGELYGLGLYDRALTADEVFESYRSRTPNPHPAGNPDDSAVVKYTFENVKNSKVPNVLNDGNFLQIPERFDLKERPLGRSISYKVNREDVVINVLGFIPFGFLGALWLRQRRPGTIVGIALLVLPAGLALSFGIEFAQAYMPTRDSALLDFVTNAIGTIFGVFAAILVAKRNTKLSKLTTS